MSYLDKKLIYWSLYLNEDSPRQLDQSEVESIGEVTPLQKLQSGIKPAKRIHEGIPGSPERIDRSPYGTSPVHGEEITGIPDSLECRNAVSIIITPDIITSLDAHPLKPHIFCLGSLDKYIRLYNVNKDKIKDWYQSTDFITAVAFSPDARLLVVGFSHGLCRVYSTTPILRYRCSVNCRNSNVKEMQASKVINIKFTGNDEFIVASSDDRIRLFNCSDLRNSTLKYKGHVSSGPILKADCNQYDLYYIEISY